MLKINLPILDNSIDISNGTILSIKDILLFRKIVLLFYQYDENSSLKIFDRLQRNVKASEIVVISDILGYEMNSPSILKMIYSDIEEQLNEQPDIKSELESVGVKIETIIRKEVVNHELDLVIDEITIQEMFKVLGLKIDEHVTSIFDKLLDILQVFKYLYKKKLLVFINVMSYFTKEEVDELFKYILLYNIDVLFIEQGDMQYSKSLFLDQDFYLNDNR